MDDRSDLTSLRYQKTADSGLSPYCTVLATSGSRLLGTSRTICNFRTYLVFVYSVQDLERDSGVKCPESKMHGDSRQLLLESLYVLY